MEKERLDKEQEKMERWMNDVKESFQKEKEILQQRIVALESSHSLSAHGGDVDKESSVLEQPLSALGSEPTEEESATTESTLEVDDVSSPDKSTIPDAVAIEGKEHPPDIGVTVSEGVTVGAGSGSGVVVPVTTSITPVSAPRIVSSAVETSLDSSAVTRALSVPVLSTLAGSTIPVVSPTLSSSSGALVSDTTCTEASVAFSGYASEASTATKHSIPLVSDGAVATSESSDVVSTVTKLLQVQMEAMAAQARAAAVQHLPALRYFTGEGKDTADDSFDRWIERFHERAKIAGWEEEQQLYHLKLHLEKTAREVFRMLPEQDRNDFNRAVTALRKRFRPADIEELRGLEFHHRMQGDETIEQLGISIQQLGRKAFPSIVGKEFD